MSNTLRPSKRCMTRVLVVIAILATLIAVVILVSCVFFPGKGGLPGPRGPVVSVAYYYFGGGRPYCDIRTDPDMLERVESALFGIQATEYALPNPRCRRVIAVYWGAEEGKRSVLLLHAEPDGDGYLYYADRHSFRSRRLDSVVEALEARRGSQGSR